MKTTRLDIERAANGFTVREWKEEGKDDNYGYTAPETYIAETVKDLTKIVTDCLTEGEGNDD